MIASFSVMNVNLCMSFIKLSPHSHLCNNG
jgi:hypothetical protein